jgi:hypothetical protein
MKCTTAVLTLVAFTVISCKNLYSQDTAKWNINGYISGLGSAKKSMSDSLFRPTGEQKSKDVLLHNRLNFFWYPARNFTFSVQLRNRLIYDETYSDIPAVGDNFEDDLGYMQLSKTWYSDGDFLINSNIDRLYFQYTKDKLEVNIGRQRINWSQTFAWNPNDIFNASNYFEIDYPEKPGSDAIRLQYYTGMASSAEAVLKIDHKKNITAAALYRMNLAGYDFQVLGGIMNEEEFVAGAGWSGNIKAIGFRGEITTLFPYKETSAYNHSMDNLFLASVSFDYTFPNNARLMSEFLYSNNSISMLSTSLTSVFSETTTIRNMAFSRLSSLLSFTYPVHPLVNVSLSGMYFYRISGFYAGPNVDFSLSDNLDFSLYWQYFNMFLSKDKRTMMDDIVINYLFLRFKYSF